MTGEEVTASEGWPVRVPVGYRTGGWEGTAPIASGAWGSVYAARRIEPPRTPGDTPLDFSAALKFLPTGKLAPAQYAYLVGAVSEEVRFSQQADHPRLIRTFDTFVVDDPDQPALHGAVVLAMERAARSLKVLLGTVTAPNPVPDAGRLIAETCEALVHLHSSGWVHGDLKPGNILVMEDGSVRLADFGLTRELEGTHGYALPLGSSDYLPPEWWSERMSEHGVACRTTADIWALGVTAHQLLTGGLFPFPGATARARTAASQAYADGRMDLRLADSVPSTWRPIIADCLAPNHTRRLPHSASEVLSRITEPHPDGEPSTSPGGATTERASSSPYAPAEAPPDAQPSPAPRRRRAWLGRRSTALLIGLTVAIMAAVVAAAALTGGGHPAEKNATVTVFNAEVACQLPRNTTCHLGLARDPYALYVRENVVGYVFHGDALPVDCYIDNGTTVAAETGRASTRWYRVQAPQAGWLPGARVRPGTEPAVGRCAQ